ncbi:hypothetical protein [Enterococcus sp. 4E1_DIV0656]|uniref:hypothetical protein n=1 Tax=Enterococcus sp. DIV1059_2 TaxID=2774664 RepID=UPI000A39E596|nr:hypothetical protein A5882_003656 [Enterococcus sp. 4E1_DIV0656]
MMSNSIQQNIKSKLIDPAISAVKHAVVGFVTVVYHDERKVDITYKDNDNILRTAKKISFPRYGDGIFSESLKAGDYVELAYRNQKKESMYIASVIKKAQNSYDFVFDKGKNLPTSTNLF